MHVVAGSWNLRSNRRYTSRKSAQHQSADTRLDELVVSGVDERIDVDVQICDASNRVPDVGLTDESDETALGRL